jgi:catechol 2,3-dioxygenase-like lactoylglutathione lyase family enzyme
MFDHIALHVKDLEASVRFYTEALAPLGHMLGSRDETSAGFGPADAPALWLYLDTSGSERGSHPGTHVAFSAGDHQMVKRFHAAGLKAGGRDNGAPALLEDYGPTYYAAFLLDPDGNNVEAVNL